MGVVQHSRLWRWLVDILPLVLWMALIFWFSSQSVLVEIEREAAEKTVYKTAHILVYAVLAWLWWRALSPRRQLNWPVLFTALALTTAYGISDEIHQLFVPGRHGRLADVLFDTSGALLMVLLIRRVKWLRLLPPVFFAAGNKEKARQIP